MKPALAPFHYRPRCVVATRRCWWTRDPEPTDRGVSHRHQHLRARPDARPVTVLAHRNVADVTNTVLDPPMPAVPGQKRRRPGPRSRHAGDRVGHLAGRLAPLPHLGLNPADLRYLRPVEVAVEHRRGRQRPALDSVAVGVRRMGLVDLSGPEASPVGGSGPARRPTRSLPSVTAGCRPPSTNSAPRRRRPAATGRVGRTSRRR